jgi:hypothetical protein
MAERLNPNLATLKAVVIVMAVLIVVGFAVVAIEIARRLSGLGAEEGMAPGAARMLSLPVGCAVAEIAGVGDRLALRIEPAASCPDLIYLDGAGREVGRVELQPAPQ